MKIVNFAFKNLCSYGNKLQSFSLPDEPQLVLVQGQNGGGKSTIADAITFSVYGKSAIRRTSELPNRFNKNGYAYIDFFTNGGDRVEVERGLAPGFTRLSVNGNEYNLPDKRRIDEYIEEELIRIPFNVFSNTISLSINEFKSFVELSPNDKRQIIDKIFGMDIVNDMSKKIKEEEKTLRFQLQSLDFAIEKNVGILNTSVAQLSTMQVEIVSNKKTRIEEIRAEIQRLETEKANHQAAYQAINGAIAGLEKAVNSAKQARSDAQAALSQLTRQLGIYENDQCPHCLSNLKDSDHVQIKTKIVEEKSEKEGQIPTLDAGVRTAETNLSAKRVELNQARDKFYHVDGQITPLKRELTALSVEEPSKTDSTEHINKVIQTIETAIRNAKEERGKVDDQIKTCVEMSEVFPGMKQILMNDIIPVLNQKLVRTSKILEFPFSFEFDMEFNPIITHLGMEVTLGSLSTGEKKKMNIIVLLCMIELIKLKHPAVNILFLDEIFSSLDVNAVYLVVDLLRTFSKKYKMTIFVISHEGLPRELFEKQYTVTKVDNFSDIQIT